MSYWPTCLTVIDVYRVRLTTIGVGNSRLPGSTGGGCEVKYIETINHVMNFRHIVLSSLSMILKTLQWSCLLTVKFWLKNFHVHVLKF